jgi:hypothetical protein
MLFMQKGFNIYPDAFGRPGGHMARKGDAIFKRGKVWRMECTP